MVKSTGLATKKSKVQAQPLLVPLLLLGTFARHLKLLQIIVSAKCKYNVNINVR